MLQPEEPLGESAFIAWQHAPRLCASDPATGETCAPYHGIWQYLRLLGVITAKTTHADGDFLSRALRDAARTGRHAHVLVSGTADYSMLAFVAAAYAAERAALETTVVDRCPTSLLLNRWYAERFGVRLATLTAEMLTFEPERPFDVICAHSFLGFFDPQRRQLLARRWHALLAPGGRVITTQRVRPGFRSTRTGGTDDPQQLCDQVVAAARAYAGPLDVTPEQLGAAAYAYAFRPRPFVITSSREVTEPFEDAGFTIDAIEEAAVAAGTSGEASGDISRPTFRLRLVAVRT
jgi:SAM-dependent methyltransferase